MRIQQRLVVSEQDEFPSSVGLDFRARLDDGRMYSGHLEAKVEVTKLSTGRLVNGSSYDGIDMVIKDLDLELKIDAMMRDFLELVVERPKSAKEAWDLITNIVKDNKRSRTNALKAWLRSIKLGDLSMEAYFRKLESIVTILASIDSPVNGEDVVHYALEGLPDKYDQVCGIMNHKDTFLDLKTARTMLIAKEMRLKSKSQSLPVDSLSSSPMVLMAKSSTSCRPSNPQVKSWRPCFNFTKGTCHFGDGCRFVHDVNVNYSAQSNVETKGSNTEELLLKLLVRLGVSSQSETNNGTTTGSNSHVNTMHASPFAFSTEPTMHVIPSLLPSPYLAT
ncbi:hybrid signal transduction histidine kinase M [Tanacetum coccineum]|uniref:Hybrid signal transduction histidine kinase M n=1 Tax=Tanacetum coccineum TaxID=301880 RepID=A0ABQ5I0Z9_9ASTR